MRYFPCRFWRGSRGKDMTTYKIGVVGCGRIASTFDRDPKRRYIATHIGAYAHLFGAKSIAICDINKNSLEECMKRWGIDRGYTTCGEMLRKEIASKERILKVLRRVIRSSIENRRWCLQDMFRWRTGPDVSTRPRGTAKKIT